ncbi:hypothetical protein DBR06_SOUSAS84310001, partial [Sousa chinensis]
DSSALERDLELCGQCNCLGLFVPTMRRDACLRKEKWPLSCLGQRAAQSAARLASEEDVHRHLVDMGAHCSVLVLPPFLLAGNRVTLRKICPGRMVHGDEPRPKSVPALSFPDSHTRTQDRKQRASLQSP